MRILAAALATLLTLTGGASAVEALSCAVPDYLLLSDHRLKRVATVTAKERRLAIAVVGTGSSVLAGPDGVSLAYPARLQAALHQRFPDIELKVSTRIKSSQTADDMKRGLTDLLAGEKPDLVVWQVGTVDAMRRVSPDDFKTTLEEGVDAIQAAGADVVFMNMQYSPRTESMIALGPYSEAIRAVVHQRRVPLFDRFGIMRYWADYNIFDFHATGRDNALARSVHDCIGNALARLIVDAGRIRNLEQKAGQQPQ